MSDNKPYYREKLAEHSALWADLYALTMSQALFTHGKHDTMTTFQAFIRKPPFGGEYLISGGQNIIAEWLENNWSFNQRALEVLRNKKVPDPATGDMKPLFSPEFLDMLANTRMELTIDALEEGDLAFPDEPIYRVRGPAWQCLMVEAAILNTINSQSLFATLASRIKEATKSDNVLVSDKAASSFFGSDPVLEFGLRRAQCAGGLEATRGAYLGGIDATSNMLAEEYYGIPTAGTFAHALVMLYEDELEAFSDYAKAMPCNGIFLVDTYDTVEGVRKAVKACKDAGVQMKGIRLDSGDMAALSIESRKILDDAGFPDAKIAASNDLEESSIRALKQKGAKIDIWGVGTNLVTSRAQPALGAVYKLVAVYDDPGLSLAAIDRYQEARQKGEATPWALAQLQRDVIKLGEKPQPGELEKATIQGEQLVLRTLFNEAGKWRIDGDIIMRANDVVPVSKQTGNKPADAVLIAPVTAADKHDPALSRTWPAGTPVTLPLKRLFDRGTFAGTHETVHEARQRAAEALTLLPYKHRQLDKPVTYPVGLEKGLRDARESLIQQLRP